MLLAPQQGEHKAVLKKTKNEKKPVSGPSPSAGFSFQVVFGKPTSFDLLPPHKFRFK